MPRTQWLAIICCSFYILSDIETNNLIFLFVLLLQFYIGIAPKPTQNRGNTSPGQIHDDIHYLQKWPLSNPKFQLLQPTKTPSKNQKSKKVTVSNLTSKDLFCYSGEKNQESIWEESVHLKPNFSLSLSNSSCYIQ